VLFALRFEMTPAKSGIRMSKNWEQQLENWANIAQIVGLLSLPLSVFLWLVTRESL
jgi:hypothetical protein